MASIIVVRSILRTVIAQGTAHSSLPVTMLFKWFLVSSLICVLLNEKFVNCESETNYRLPNNTIPTKYDITLTTNVHKNDFNFSGTVLIDLRVLETSSNITLHARQVEIKTVKLTAQNGTTVQTNQFIHSEKTDFLTIPTQVELEKNSSYRLSIEYVGELRTDQNGFYRSSYVNSEGVTKWYAASFFQPTDARHAFPCYDEPGTKAKFIIRIVHGESYHAISNMPVTKSSVDNGIETTDFDETPLMSTYLVAFIVSDFEYKRFNATDEFNMTQRIFSTKDTLNQTSYPLVEGITILKAMEDYIQIPCRMPKLDHAAIPNTRADLAMENWGLLTYPADRLLFDTTIHLAERQFISTQVIAHEISHQWLGNLVTPKWWSHLWLSEGFATLFESFVSNLVHPYWISSNEFIISNLQKALRADAQVTSHPMTYYVESPEDVENIFDKISYAKAGSVIRMMMHALGAETFRKGLNYYLTNNTYGVADEDTLFERLEAAAKEDNVLSSNFHVKDLFGSWSNQKGFPLLNITLNYNDGSVTLHQVKYDGIFASHANDSSTWWIPFNFASAKNPIFNVTNPFGWISKGQREVVITPNQGDITWTNDDWLIFNRQQTGYYRILYDEKNYELINKQLNEGEFDVIHAINRAQILDDLNEFVYNGYTSSAILCDTLTYLKSEDFYAPWETAKRVIKQWKRKIQISDKFQTFEKFIADLVESNYDRWTLQEHDKDDVFNKMSRATAVNLACEFGVRRCLEETHEKFDLMINGNNFSPDIRRLIIRNGIRSASDGAIAQLWEIFLKSNNTDVRGGILSSITNIPNITTVEFYLEKSMEGINDTTIGVSEFQLLLISVADRDQSGVLLVIEFLKSLPNEIFDKIGSLTKVLKTLAKHILTLDTEKKFRNLLNLLKNKALISEKDMITLLSTASENVLWQANFMGSFEENFFQPKCMQFSNNGGNNGGNSLLAFPIIVISFVIFHFIIN